MPLRALDFRKQNLIRALNLKAIACFFDSSIVTTASAIELEYSNKAGELVASEVAFEIKVSLFQKDHESSYSQQDHAYAPPDVTAPSVSSS